MNRKRNSGRVLFIVLLIMAAFTAIAPAQKTSADSGTLIVVITGFEPSTGYAMVALNSSKEQYEDGSVQAFAKKKGKIENGAARVVFSNIPYGEYGVSLYHDENSNGKMDKNAMGIPKESYAFSNNATGMFGKPDWDDVKFKVDAPEKQISIRID